MAPRRAEPEKWTVVYVYLCGNVSCDSSGGRWIVGSHENYSETLCPSCGETGDLIETVRDGKRESLLVA